MRKSNGPATFGVDSEYFIHVVGRTHGRGGGRAKQWGWTDVQENRFSNKKNKKKGLEHSACMLWEMKYPLNIGEKKKKKKIMGMLQIFERKKKKKRVYRRIGPWKLFNLEPARCLRPLWTDLKGFEAFWE